MTRTIRHLASSLAGLALALTIGACGRQAPPPPQMPVMTVRTAAAVQMDAPVVIGSFGTADERASVDVIPQVSGVLLEACIADGAVVTNGQPLFRIDPSDYAARVRQAEGVVTADRANLELSRSTLDRNRLLLEKKLIAPDVFDALRTRAAAAAAQLQIDEAMLDQARLSLARCTVVAPMDGVCSRRYIDEGNLVGAGQTRLVNIRSYDPINLSFSVSEVHLADVRRAMAAGPVRLEVVPRDSTNRHEGTLEFVDNAVNPLTGSVLLRGRAPNPDLALWARQYVDVRIFAGAVPGAVMVPEGAVQYGKRGPYLYAVSADGKAELRPVRPGVRWNDLIQVMEGVAPGERIVVLGQLMLFPGAAVKEEAAPTGGAAPAVGGHGGA